MRDRLPVHIENRDLPTDRYESREMHRHYSYGYVNILFLASIITTILSVVTVIMVRK